MIKELQFKFVVLILDVLWLTSLNDALKTQTVIFTSIAPASIAIPVVGWLQPFFLAIALNRSSIISLKPNPNA
jgi:hypothetical protein